MFSRDGIPPGQGCLPGFFFWTTTTTTRLHCILLLRRVANRFVAHFCACLTPSPVPHSFPYFYLHVSSSFAKLLEVQKTQKPRELLLTLHDIRQEEEKEAANGRTFSDSTREGKSPKSTTKSFCSFVARGVKWFLFSHSGKDWKKRASKDYLVNPIPRSVLSYGRLLLRRRWDVGGKSL